MKKTYEAPEVQVIEMEVQGIIAASDKFGNPDIPNNNI